MSAINELIPVNSSIALVGNGGSLLEAECGESIDSHQVVIRFNNFDTSNSLSKHSGTKTSFWANTFYQDITSRKNYPPILCPLPLNQPGYTEMYNTNLNLLILNLPKTTFIPEEIYIELCKLMPTHKIKNRKDPSTGLCMIYWLIKSGFKIKANNLFGFDFFSNKKQN